MQLSEINKKNLTDEEIEQIVYEGIQDSGENAYYGLVFGNSMLIKERVKTAIEAFQQKRIKKIIFTGGTGGVSNQNRDPIAEAIKMKKLAIYLGIKEEDILIETEANNTFENIDNAIKLMDSTYLDKIIIITSEFHLKRCVAILKKKYPYIKVITIPSKDGYSDKDNWFLSDASYNSGRSLVTYEANLLIKYAKEEKIEDLEITGFDNKKVFK